MPIPPFNLRWLILLAVFACLVTALGSTEESEADLKEVKMQLNIEAFQKAVKKVREEKRISIKIETITECDQRDVLPGGCRHPIQVYPVLEGPPYIEWAFEKRYTITWGNVDDNYPQRFQWDTGYCGSVNKTIPTGQRHFDFTFKDLATEFPKSQCNYTMKEFRRQANSATNEINVRQPEKPGIMIYGHGLFPILDDWTNDDVRRLRYGKEWALHGRTGASSKACRSSCNSKSKWLDSYSGLALASSIVAIVSFCAGTRFGKGTQGSIQLK